ncbi:MAG TPA: LptF/LptG family permease [Bacteroidia bacterium]|jgi:lipopolysaccharide export system permease protein
MKLIDKYIIGKFLGTFFFSLLLIILIVVVFDISEKIEDFIGKEAPLKAIIFDYYFNFIPYFINLFSPLFTFIAVIFFTSRMASRTEIVAILSSGVSYTRLLFPYMLSATVIAILSLTLNNFVIPHATKKMIEFENTYIRNEFYNRDRNIHKQISPGNYIYLQSYNTEENTGYKFSIEKFNKGKLYYKMMAESIKWDSIKKDWTINDYYVRFITEKGEFIKKGLKIDTTLAFTPKEFGRKDNTVGTMDYYELDSYIAAEQLKGSDNIELLFLEKYRRVAFPFATFILTLIGVSIASRKVRGGIGMHIGMGIGISFTFIMFMQVSTTFAAGGLLKPLLAVWIPNIIFGFLAWYLLKIAQK